MTAQRLLFVDDDAMVARLFGRIAGKLGYVVDTASGSGEAVRLSTFREYDVIATDLVMSDMNGVELVERLAATSPNTVFLLVTGAADLTPFYSTVADRRIAGVLGKPFDPEHIDSALRGAFAMSARRRAGAGPSERKNRTLLVEDSPTDALILSDALEALDGEVQHVCRLSDAVRKLHDQRFDTIVTDLSLPDARGLDAVTRLRTCAADATLIVCSAVTDDALELQVIELGAHDFLTKSGLNHASVARAVRFARVRRSSEKRLARLAYYDALTGLANRTLFHERLGELVRTRRRAQSSGVMFLDLNGFKGINDVFGHDAGDAVLCEFASRMRASVRESDLCARLGGDEFAILAPSVDREQLEGLAKRILVSACRLVQFGDIEIPVATSIGLAMFPECGDSPQQLLMAADIAMYEAKRGADADVPIRFASGSMAPLHSSSPMSRPRAR
jgi:two-component system cell cycle response regulator